MVVAKRSPNPPEVLPISYRTANKVLNVSTADYPRPLRVHIDLMMMFLQIFTWHSMIMILKSYHVHQTRTGRRYKKKCPMTHDANFYLSAVELIFIEFVVSLSICCIMSALSNYFDFRALDFALDFHPFFSSFQSFIFMWTIIVWHAFVYFRSSITTSTWLFLPSYY